MDQDKQKTSDFDLLMGDEMDDGSFEALWEEASKPLADKTGTSETDPLLASTIGRLLDWDDISNDKALWNELDARVAAKNLEKSQASEKGDASEPKSDVQEASLDSDLVLDSPEVSEEETAPKLDEASRNKILAMIGKKQASDDGGEATANKAKEIAKSMLSFELDDEFVANYSRKGDARTHEKVDSSKAALQEDSGSESASSEKSENVVIDEVKKEIIYHHYLPYRL